tara:strand:- start:162 stop:347 length:186 start_codon:yes stop_codon:yes gene_type:complete
MTSIRERINSHLPIVLQLLSTASLVILAACAICGSKSLRELAVSHNLDGSVELHKDHNHSN